MNKSKIISIEEEHPGSPLHTQTLLHGSCTPSSCPSAHQTSIAQMHWDPRHERPGPRHPLRWAVQIAWPQAQSPSVGSSRSWSLTPRRRPECTPLRPRINRYVQSNPTSGSPNGIQRGSAHDENHTIHRQQQQAFQRLWVPGPPGWRGVHQRWSR